MITLTRGLTQMHLSSRLAELVEHDEQLDPVRALVTDSPPQAEPAPQSGSHERHLAAGSAAQQVTLITSMVTGFVVVTVLARRLSLSEFGAYGLLISLPAYLVFAQGSIETVVVRAIAQARDEQDRDRAFTTAVCLYSILGLLTALVIALGGIALLGVLKIAPRLHHQAVLSLLSLAVVNLIGWPIKAALDCLRATGRFVT